MKVSYCFLLNKEDIIITEVPAGSKGGGLKILGVIAIIAVVAVREALVVVMRLQRKFCYSLPPLDYKGLLVNCSIGLALFGTSLAISGMSELWLLAQKQILNKKKDIYFSRTYK